MTCAGLLHPQRDKVINTWTHTACDEHVRLSKETVSLRKDEGGHTKESEYGWVSSPSGGRAAGLHYSRPQSISSDLNGSAIVTGAVPDPTPSQPPLY